MRPIYIYIASVITLFYSSFSFACDFCGSASNGGSLGLLNFNKNSYIGMKYIHQSYKTNDGLYLNSPWEEESYNTLQTYGKIVLSNDFFISAIIPYHFHYREVKTVNNKISGVGDITILLGYQLLSFNSHELQIVGGFTLPTGRFDVSSNGSINPGFQLGSSSYDFILGADYRLLLDNFIWNNSIMYNYKTVNDEEYKFGNQLNLSSSISYKLNLHNFEFLPFVGIASEFYDSNEFLNRDVLNTKGDVTFLKLGTDVNVNNFSFGFQFQSPISQNLNGGFVKSNYRSSVYINYNL